MSVYEYQTNRNVRRMKRLRVMQSLLAVVFAVLCVVRVRQHEWGWLAFSVVMLVLNVWFVVFETRFIDRYSR